CQQHDNYPPSF
nr:immunoglobulin light chain junction region [Macaca mulatta]MOW09574.1 immunoglobulin light chain junction region [Macaca mulatta]MOW09674.1 immunoglobulin light chain junction region [Macaca mulatta]MOW10615.1 immunoglobulin light chain junction region [Macaca mulatta]MOW11219.1 immunoglobulin light chain junction region [Macaca mulatta]